MTPEVLDLRLTGNESMRATAVVRIGFVEFRGVRVVEREGRMKVRLPGAVVDQPVFSDLRRAVLDAYRQAVEADPWADVRRTGAEHTC